MVINMKQKFTFFDIVNYFVYILITIISIYPFYYVVIYSISNPELASRAILLPKGFSLQTYKTIFSLNNIVGAFGISVLRTFLGAAVTVICTSFLAYLMTKQEMFARQLVYRFFVITMYINAGLIPWYLTMRAYGLKDNFLLYIVPGAVSAYYMILIKTYMESLPASMEESARIDGAGELTILTRIYVPLAKALYATFGLMAVVGVWNSYYEALLYIKEPGRQPIQMLLRKIVFTQNTANMTNAQVMISNGDLNPLNVQYACIIATIGPILLVYPFIQKYFAQGMQVGAVKG